MQLIMNIGGICVWLLTLRLSVCVCVCVYVYVCLCLHTLMCGDEG